MATHCTVTTAVDLADFSVCWLLIVARAEVVAEVDVIALEDLKDWIRGYARQSAPPREVSETRELIKNLRDVVKEAEKNTALSETEIGGWGSQASDDDFPYSEDEPFWFSDSESYSA